MQVPYKDSLGDSDMNSNRRNQSFSETQPHRKDFEALSGAWGKEDKDDFEKSVADFENIEDSMPKQKRNF